MHIQLDELVGEIVALVVRVLLCNVVVLELVVHVEVDELEGTVVELLVVLVEEIVLLLDVGQVPAHSQSSVQGALFVHSLPHPVHLLLLQFTLEPLTSVYSVLLNIARRNINFKMFIVRL